MTHKKLVAEVRLKVFIDDIGQTIPEVEENIKDYIVEGKYIINSVKVRITK